MRITPRPDAGELELLVQYLDYQRDTIMLKTDALTREEMAMTVPPSSLTLGGVLNHLALVEDDWMQVRFLGLEERQPWAGVDWNADPDWEFRTAADLEPEQLRVRYQEACDRSRAVVAEATSLARPSVRPLRDGRQFSLRWVLLHLLEETARHAGHADLLREAADGSVGE
jgi:uncharacterized damage-inducible protein DinB